MTGRAVIQWCLQYSRTRQVRQKPKPFLVFCHQGSKHQQPLLERDALWGCSQQPCLHSRPSTRPSGCSSVHKAPIGQRHAPVPDSTRPLLPKCWCFLVHEQPFACGEYSPPSRHNSMVRAFKVVCVCLEGSIRHAAHFRGAGRSVWNEHIPHSTAQEEEGKTSLSFDGSHAAGRSFSQNDLLHAGQEVQLAGSSQRIRIDTHTDAQAIATGNSPWEL